MYIFINPDFSSTASEFIKCIRYFGGDFNQWYVGLTNNPKESFLNIHNMDVLDKNWILSNKCHTYQLLFLKTLLTQMGIQNNPEYDLNNPDQIYLYQISDKTKEGLLRE